jgi:phosphoglycolate phosphatase
MNDHIIVDLIVFDLDGTLADSLPDLTNAANFACRTLGLPERPLTEVKGMIGSGERKFVERFVGPENQQHVERALELYLDYCHRHVGELTRLYPGVQETLGYYLSRIKLAVLSNKHQSLTEQVLRVMGILPMFAAVRGGGSDLALKPSSEPLLALLRDLGVPGGQALMVGDKVADIVAGRGAGTFTAAATYGYGDLAALTAAAPDFFIGKFAELRELVRLE